MSDFIVSFIILCLGFGLGVLFNMWQTRAEDQLDADEEFDQSWREANEQRAATAGLSSLPPEWARPGVN